MPSDKEISDLDTIIQTKMSKNRTERSTLNRAQEAISSIKMRSRQVEDKPAVKGVEPKPAVMDPKDPTKELKAPVPGVQARPPVMKTVFDVMPQDPIIQSKEMSEERRQEIFDACKTDFGTE